MKYHKWILLLITIVGLFLRIWESNTNPISLYWDEASIGYEAYSIATTGKDMHGNTWLQAIFPAYGDYKAPVYIWAASLCVKVLGPTNLAVRLPSILAGTMTLITVYFLGYVLFSSKKIAIYASLAMAFLPGHIHFSRAGFEANLALLFISLSLALFLQGLRSQKVKWFALSSLSSLIAVYSYFSARIVVPLMILAISIYAWKTKKSVVGTILFFSIFIIGLFPLYKSPYFEEANVLRLSTDNITKNEAGILYSNKLRQEDNNAKIVGLFHHRYILMGRELVENVMAHVEPQYLFFKGDPNSRHSSGFAGVMLATTIPCFYIGLLALLKKNTHMWLLLIVWWIIFLLPAAVPRSVPHTLRSLNSLIPIVLLIGLGIKEMGDWAKTGWRRIVCVSYLVAVLLNFGVYTTLLHTFYAKESRLSWQDGYPQLGSYVKTQYDQYDYIVVPPGDRLFLYVLFYGQFPPQQMQLEQVASLQKTPNKFTPDQIGKITLRPIMWQDDIRGPSSSLLIGPRDAFPSNVNIKDEIRDSHGEVQFIAIDLREI